MSDNLAKILGTNGSVAAIRGLGLTNAELAEASHECAMLPGYRGEAVCERDALTGEVLMARERVTIPRALASAIALAQQ